MNELESIIIPVIRTTLFFLSIFVFFLNRALKRGGGAAILVDSYITVNKLDEFTAVKSKYEVLALQNDSKFLHYRRPGTNVASFCYFINNVLDSGSLNKLQMIMCGDFNMNINASSSRQSELISTFDSFGFLALLMLPHVSPETHPL